MTIDRIFVHTGEEPFIIWHGGPCPVMPDVGIDVVFRNGERQSGAAAIFQWNHFGKHADMQLDIVAYRVVEAAVCDARPVAPIQHPFTVPGYEQLASVLERAYQQAAVGKGAQRHVNAGEPFHEQVMQIGAKRFGVGCLLFQAFKKSEEAQRLPVDRAVAELLGAINYLAGAVIAIERDGL